MFKLMRCYLHRNRREKQSASNLLINLMNAINQIDYNYADGGFNKRMQFTLKVALI